MILIMLFTIIYFYNWIIYIFIKKNNYKNYNYIINNNIPYINILLLFNLLNYFLFK